MNERLEVTKARRGIPNGPSDLRRRYHGHGGIVQRRDPTSRSTTPRSTIWRISVTCGDILLL